MFIQATNLREGSKIQHEDDAWIVLSFQHRTPGKGQACMQVKLRSLTTGSSKEVRFNSTERIPQAEVEERRMMYSYHDGHDYVFMDNQTYEQFTLTEEQLGNAVPYLTEGMEVFVQYYKGEPIDISPPNFVELKVDYAEPAVRGDTATNVTKTVKMENGLEVQAPLFINSGDVLKIDTRDGSYVERMSKG